MKKNKVRILGSNNNDFLDVSLEDIIFLLTDNDIFWKLIWIEATSTDENCNILNQNFTILEFEEKVNSNEDGMLISLSDLLILDKWVNQYIELLIIGDRNIKTLKKYSSDLEMERKCSYVISLIDSSYWEICSDDLRFIKRLFLDLSNSNIVPV